jgi:ATP-dependent Clp protease ATP-binding subunit ClpA
MAEYKVHSEQLKTCDYELLVLEIPASEIEDKLAYLAREKGRITKSLFEDFVIATCVANINQLIFHLGQQTTKPPKLMEVRAEIMEKIVKHNSSFDSTNLYINRNFVVKVLDGELPENAKMLTDNKMWETSYYDEVLNPNVQSEAPDNVPAAPPPPKKKPSAAIKDVDELDFTEITKWWKRIGQYIKIRKFDDAEEASILSQKYFYDKGSFFNYIVSVCVVDVEELFALLDSMGLPARVSPPTLMAEIYSLCKETNPFLTYANAREYQTELKDDTPENGNKMGKKGKRPSTMAGYAEKKKPKPKFKDVPRERLLGLANAMSEHLIGQDEAITNLTESIKRASVGLKDPVKPIGSFLFAGRTGVGKTLATKVLADSLVQEKDSLVTIDCSEYTADHEYSKLIGAPAGYVGHESGGLLTNSVSKNPFSIVVFDEVEKASHKVHQLMLQILEEGRLTDGKGSTVPFNDTIIIMTSNVGVKEIDSIKKTVGFGSVAEVTDEKKDLALTEALKKKFKPEFLNRIDAIVNFRTLIKDDYMRIIDLELGKLEKNLNASDTDFKDIKITFEEAVRDYIYKEGTDLDYGARPLKRCIEKEISTPLAQALLERGANSVAAVVVKFEDEKIEFEFENKTAEPPFYVNPNYEAEENVMVAKED